MENNILKLSEEHKGPSDEELLDIEQHLDDYEDYDD
mgnify:CR=1 FL=1